MPSAAGNSFSVERTRILRGSCGAAAQWRDAERVVWPTYRPALLEVVNSGARRLLLRLVSRLRLDLDARSLRTGSNRPIERVGRQTTNSMCARTEARRAALDCNIGNEKTSMVSWLLRKGERGCLRGRSRSRTRCGCVGASRWPRALRGTVREHGHKDNNRTMAYFASTATMRLSSRSMSCNQLCDGRRAVRHGCSLDYKNGAARPTPLRVARHGNAGPYVGQICDNANQDGCVEQLDVPKFCFDVPHPWLLEAALQRLAAACADPDSRALVGAC